MRRWLASAWLLLWSASAWTQASLAPADAGTACAVQILSIHAARPESDGGRPAAPDWQTVTLPHDWRREHPDFDGGSVWYRIDWRRDCPGAPPQPVALLLQSVVLAGEVFVNEHHLFSDESLVEPLSRSWNMPRQWLLPEAWLREGPNTLLVRVVSVGGGQSAGLGPVFLGPPKLVRQRHDELRWRYRTLFEINILVSGLIGVLFFSIWVIRRDQRFYGWYAFASLFWIAFIANILLTDPWPFTSSLALARANTAAMLLFVAGFCMFTRRFGAQETPRTERALWGATALLIAALAAVPDAWVGGAQWTGFLLASAIFYLNFFQFLAHAWRTREREHLMLAGWLLVLCAAGLHDAAMMLGLIQAKPVFPYATIVTTLALSAILGLRHARNLRRIERFNQELTTGIAQARNELAATLERDHALAVANTRLQERLRVAHDLHDGLGGSLVHMMASVEQGDGPLQRDQVLSMLKFIRNDLRQTIDNDSSSGVTVATPQAWIAPLRHRFTILFDELGISADWQFPSAWRTPPTALQYLALTRLVEEALTNVIKHSRARRLELRLSQPEPDELILRIEDDGIGFDVSAVRQADISIGVRSMSVRIARAGGALDVVSKPGSTVLTARLKLARPEP